MDSTVLAEVPVTIRNSPDLAPLPASPSRPPLSPMGKVASPIKKSPDPGIEPTHLRRRRISLDVARSPVSGDLPP